MPRNKTRKNVQKRAQVFCKSDALAQTNQIMYNDCFDLFIYLLHDTENAKNYFLKI